MREFLDGTDLFNALMLSSSASSRPVLVVEGESDFNLTSDFFDREQLEIMVGYGKRSLLEAGILANGTRSDVRFLIDADFDRLTGAVREYGANILITDYYDLYMDLYFTSRLGVERIVRRHLRESPLSVAEAIDLSVSLAEALGKLRYVSVTGEHFLNLEKYPVHMVFPKPAEPVDVTALVHLAVLRTKPGVFDEQSIIHQIEQISTPECADAMLNSHDLMSALSAACRINGSGKQSHSFDDLFELAVDAEHFAQLGIVIEIRQWLELQLAA